MTARDVTALMGAHSVGQTNGKKGSGFLTDGAWVEQPPLGRFHFNNRFYHLLQSSNVSWTQFNAGDSSSQIWQWRGTQVIGGKESIVCEKMFNMCSFLKQS